MASSSSSTHRTPASSRSFKYDVFLSFRGEDTRKTFVDHLYSALEQRLVITYKDDEALPRGESIRPSLFKAIEESRIAIIIFSKNHADSSWCLEELAHIMKCKEERELIVMPIFYDLDPSEVRKQKGDFGKAFAQQEVENNNKAQIWKNALVDASNIAGWEPKHIANGHESKVIKEIVHTPSNAQVDKDLVGMKSRLEDLKSQLEIGSECVRMVGIWGGGGSGKTTLATSMYMELCHHFQGHCIVENVREQSNDLKKLQETMLSAVFKRKVKIPNVAEGKLQIKTMLCSRNVLIVLDDVNDLDQLSVLVGSHSWFGSGSRIIITTRDEHLLRTHKVDEVCHARLLSDDEAMQLFNKHAYNENEPIEDYDALSLRVVSYAAGLPLALQVLGSFLYDKEKKGWMSTLHRLKDIPETKIVEKLEISYDGLKMVEKELFLDIACFFRGVYKNMAMEMLEAFDFYPEIGIEVLRQKALISIVDGRLEMHDLVQEMGHYIVRREHPNNPKKHSRIWKCEEINNMCIGNATIENDKIEAIKYDYGYSHDLGHELQFCKIVSNLKKLRYLMVRIEYPKYVEGPTFLSNELRSIDWDGYPSKSPFSNNFQPMKLVVLKLKRCLQKEVWKGCKYLPHLQVLELCDMTKLIITPDFDGLPCLKKLTLLYCYKLKEIHPSLGHHKSLESVSVSRCYKLRMFPTIVHMENLKTLEIEECDKILDFPKFHANMDGLVKLSMERTGIEVFPSSIGECCTNLMSLNLSSEKNLKSIEFNFDALKNLKELHLQGLIRHGVNFYVAYKILDFSLSQLTRLKLLNLSWCEKLLEFPELPSSLTILQAKGCKSLTAFGDCHKNCRWLCQVELGRGCILSDGQKLLESMFEVCTAFENSYMLLQLSGVEIAKGFTPSLIRGDRCTLQLPENWCNDFSGFLMCLAGRDGYCVRVRISMNEEINGVNSHWVDSGGYIYTFECTQIVYVSFRIFRQTVWWDQTYKALEFEALSSCSGFGVRLVDKKSRTCLKETPTEYSSRYTPTYLTDCKRLNFVITLYPRLVIDNHSSVLAGPTLFRKSQVSHHQARSRSGARMEKRKVGGIRDQRSFGALRGREKKSFPHLPAWDIAKDSSKFAYIEPVGADTSSYSSTKRSKNSSSMPSSHVPDLNEYATSTHDWKRKGKGVVGDSSTKSTDRLADVIDKYRALKETKFRERKEE